MKIQNLFLFLALVIAATFSSCGINCVDGTGKIVNKTLPIENFTELELNSSIAVFIEQGTEQKVEVKGNENIIELLNKELNGDTWEIEFDKCINSSENVEIHITLAEINRIELNGSGSISSKNAIKGEIFEVILDGSGDMNLDLQVKELETVLNGSGDLQLSGSTKTHAIELDGSGDVNAEDLMSDNVEINLNGSGDVRVNTSYELDIKVNGSGDVYYKGNVKNIRSDINGSGNLHQIAN